MSRRRVAFGFALALALLAASEIGAYFVVSASLGGGSPEGDGAPAFPYAAVYRDAVGDALPDVERYQANPLFGHQSTDRSGNNHGFESTVDYPYQAKSDECVIAILGGSVAEDFASYVQSNALAKKRLTEVLAPDKRLIVLNMALSAGKQPQQFTLAAAFLSSYHLSINIEGFNEMDTDYPSLPLDYPIITNQLYFHDAEHRALRDDLKAMRTRQQDLSRLPLRFGPLSYSSVYFAAYTAAIRRLDAAIAQGTVELQEDYAHWNGRFARADPEPDVEARMRALSGNWTKYVDLQHAISTRAGKPAFFFVQPNQYVAGSKPLSAEESSTFTGQAAYADEVPTRYAHLQRGASALAAQGVPVFDLTRVFATTQRTVYADDCCHLNALGNALVARRILAVLRAAAPDVCR